MTLSPPGYAFGTNATAAKRLLAVANVFDPAMRAVLAELPPRRWSRVVDLGCGPGSSTARLLGHLGVRGGTVVGLDSSAAFVRAARRRVPGATFVVADVAEPLPVVAPELVYARFLLSHLPDPLAVVEAWVGELADGGFLVLEEPERIDTDDPAFRDYLDVTGGVVASRGATMLVGPTLASLNHASVVLNRTVAHPVDPRDAALLFSLNLTSVREDPWVHAHVPADHVDRIAARLEAIRTGSTTSAAGAAAAPVTWSIRQVVLSA
jgi:trans-aconitate 2-methyltransferase